MSNCVCVYGGGVKLVTCNHFMILYFFLRVRTVVSGKKYPDKIRERGNTHILHLYNQNTNMLNIRNIQWS